MNKKISGYLGKGKLFCIYAVRTSKNFMKWAIVNTNYFLEDSGK